MYYFLVQAFKWVFDVDSKIITYKGFTFKVTAVFGHHVAIIRIAACLSRETTLVQPYHQASLRWSVFTVGPGMHWI
jgi:tripartite-type tricarboxylate transporter receptor subunit TctC